MLGRTLSHYKVLEEISRGGMGVVYRALDLKLDREVALKVLPQDLVADSERKRRFIQEAKAAAKLEHPHIGVVHEIDEVDGVTFIAMELIRGEQLRDVIASGPVSMRRTLEIATEVAEGLAKAHEEGIVHRDLKPANVMVTEDGHTKIIDFGLAKLIEPLGGEDSDLETRAHGEPVRRPVRRSLGVGGSLGESGTDPGKVMGTAAYMSPEQARGQKVDHRTDIFSFGIVFYEMLTGEPPFKAPSGPETLSAIINAPTPSVSSAVTGDVAPEIERIVNKCLEKDSAERYQGMKDLIVDLRAARRRLESGSVTPVARPSRRKPWLYIGMIVVAALVLVGTILLVRSPTRDETPSPQSKPSIAVLFFDNNSGDPSLDWLRTALADMLITDLSQSPQLRILGTETIYQILKEMNQLDERITSLEVVQEVAERSDVDTVLLGSFVKLGDTVRINVRLQHAQSGEILTTEKVEGVGESSIFPMLDDISRRIKDRFETAGEDYAGLDLELKDITSASIEAQRHYTEGLNLHNAGINTEALEAYKRAVALDPGFAKAMVRLSEVSSNGGFVDQAEEYARRALEQQGRLSAPDRLFAEGFQYAVREGTWDRAIRSFERVLELYPDYGPARLSLGYRNLRLERYEEALEILEKLRHRQYPFIGAYTHPSIAYANLGLFEEGYQALLEYIERNPRDYVGHANLGRHLIWWGKLDEAAKVLRKAASIRSYGATQAIGRWSVAVLHGDLPQAETIASSNPIWSSWLLHYNRLYQGRSRESLTLLEEATQIRQEINPNAELDRTMARLYNRAASVFLDRGQWDEALTRAETAQRRGRGDWGEWWGLFTMAAAQAHLGRFDEAASTAEELRSKTALLPGHKEERRYRHLLGELALIRGDVSLAVQDLQKAESMLPPRGFGWLPLIPKHVSLWFSLARAHLEAGDEEEAATWFRRITESSVEHVRFPIPYVRSFYFLGKIHENRGEMEQAREYYRRFYEYWKDGNLDREKVEEAKRKIE